MPETPKNYCDCKGEKVYHPTGSVCPSCQQWLKTEEWSLQDQLERITKLYQEERGLRYDKEVELTTATAKLERERDGALNDRRMMSDSIGAHATSFAKQRNELVSETEKLKRVLESVVQERAKLKYQLTASQSEVQRLTKDLSEANENCQTNYITILELRKQLEESDKIMLANTSAAILLKTERDSALALIEKLKGYAEHSDNCEYVLNGNPCICGLSDEIAKANTILSTPNQGESKKLPKKF